MSHKSKLVLVGVVVLLVATGAMAKGKRVIKPQHEVSFGVKMAQRGLWAEALFRFRAAEKMGDTRSAVYNNIAVACEALGLFEEAQDYYKKALDTDPKSVPLRRNYSRFVEFYQSFQPDERGDGESAVTALSEGEPAASETNGSP